MPLMPLLSELLILLLLNWKPPSLKKCSVRLNVWCCKSKYSRLWRHAAGYCRCNRCNTLYSYRGVSSLCWLLVTTLHCSAQTLLDTLCLQETLAEDVPLMCDGSPQLSSASKVMVKNTVQRLKRAKSQPFFLSNICFRLKHLVCTHPSGTPMNKHCSF